MDNAKRQLLEQYLDAARNEPGMSEAEAWEIFERRLASDKPAQNGSDRHLRRTLIILIAFAVLVAIPFIYFRSSDTTPVTTGETTTSEQQQKSDAANRKSESTDTKHRHPPSSSIVMDESGSNDHSTVQSHHHPAKAFGREPASPKPDRTLLDGHNAPLSIEQLQRELGIAASDYWRMHLDAYKRTLEQILTPEDFDTLNHLRVRFAILAWQLARDTTDRQQREQEIVQTYNATSVISGHNKEACNQLRGVVLRNYTKFLALMHQRADSMIASHRRTTNPSVDSLLSDLGMVDTVIARLGTKEHEGELEMIYEMGIAPMVMLYNGADLKTMMEQLELVMNVEGMPMNTRSIPGFAALPDSSLLRSAVASPASKQVTIAYGLLEPSDSTLLRIYDAQGDVVELYDQGAQSVGEHSIVADLSKLARGPYLYHLTINTSRGEQVYSKILQVGE